MAVGADHGGFKLKEELKKYLDSKGFFYIDLGNTKLDKKDDYPKFALEVARHVKQSGSMGILVCTAGIGMSIAANKVDRVRAAFATNEREARLSREHNHSNVLCISGKLKPAMAKRIVNAWLKAKPLKGKHQRRVNQIRMIEQMNGRL
ncbi:RpiB/LacA/LacB family sugar-phosphate isomerase [Candidatus Woesearchaeota archaeon]|nr:RpiB/LacA/LacB family sugar-phosphate isomerase [Candidatus Woesearchaeota archaeon]